MTKIKSTRPKYQQIGETLVNQVLQFEYDVGDSLPTERVLCEQFSISRHTAREALRYAERTGLVERRQGSGTTVIRNAIPEQLNQFVNSVQDLMELASQTKFDIKVSDKVPLQQEYAQLLNVAVGTECIHLGGLRSEAHNKTPLCFTNIYRLPKEDDTDKQLQLKDKAVYAVMAVLDESQIGKIEQQITACLLEEEQAKRLEVETNSAAMKIVRRYYSKDQSEIILAAESIYPASRFSYSLALFPD